MKASATYITVIAPGPLSTCGFINGRGQFDCNFPHGSCSLCTPKKRTNPKRKKVRR